MSFILATCFWALRVCFLPARMTTSNYICMLVYQNPLGSVPKSIIILWAVGVAFNNYITTIMSRPLEWDTAKLLNIRVGKGSLV